MSIPLSHPVSKVPGIEIRPDAQVVLSGAPLALLEAIDAMVVRWARELGATEHRYSPLLPVKQLNEIEHFSSFPHQALFPASVHDDALDEFASKPLRDAGDLRVSELAEVHYCLAPGACFPLYFSLTDQDLDANILRTMKSPCFRKETTSSPLTRQATFTMREVVYVAAQESVQRFLEDFQERLTAFFQALDVPVTFEHATDPFFNPARNQKYVMQKISPLKLEMMYDGLAVGSLNNHRDSFGKILHIDRDGSPAYSACVAFGLERWLYMIIDHFGPEPENWPALLQEGTLGNG